MRISHEDLKDLFKRFRWIDNIPEDQEKRDEICVEAKAALLLEANIKSEMMPAFLRREKFEPQKHSNRYELPYPVTFETQLPLTTKDFNVVKVETPRLITLQHFDFLDKNDKMGKLWGPAQKTVGNTIFYNVYYKCDKNIVDDMISDKSLEGPKFESKFYQKYPSFYSICKDLTPYKTPAEICRFWGCSAEPFAKIKVRNMRPDYIWGNIMLDKNPGQENWTFSCLMQNVFSYLIPCQSPLLPDFRLTNHYDDWYCQVFPFRNEYGEEIMKLIKVYDRNIQNKYLLPVTTWIRNNSPFNQLFCVPYPSNKTPLYNLDSLLAPACETVILCDSVELADANEHENGFGDNVFTSFICSPGKYDQVDWSPLRDKDIVILVSNHSGMDLASAALKAKELREYLREQQDFEPALAVMPVDYGKNRALAFNNVDDIINRFKRTPPKVNPDDLRIIETKTEMEDFFRNAEEEVNKLPDE